MLCRRCFRENRVAIGFVKYRWIIYIRIFELYIHLFFKKSIILEFVYILKFLIIFDKVCLKKQLKNKYKFERLTL